MELDDESTCGVMECELVVETCPQSGDTVGGSGVFRLDGGDDCKESCQHSLGDEPCHDGLDHDDITYMYGPAFLLAAECTSKEYNRSPFRHLQWLAAGRPRDTAESLSSRTSSSSD